MADLFFILNKTNIANYADDNTPYISSNEVNGLIKSLGEAPRELLKWFDGSLIESNPKNVIYLLTHMSMLQSGNFQIEGKNS